MKTFGLIVFALVIDGLQALISLGLILVASTGGTFAGGALGCAAGNYVAGEIGCLVGGSVLGIFGSLANAALAPFLIPIGVGLGFAINICLSVVLGGMLIALLWHLKMLYVGYTPGYLLEIVPGVANFPFWTGFVVASVIRKKAEDVLGAGKLASVSSILSPKSSLGAMANGVLGMRRAASEKVSQTNPGLYGQMTRWAAGTTAQKNDEHQKAASSLIQTFDGVRPPKRAEGGLAKGVGLALLLSIFFIGASSANAQGMGSQPDPVQYIVSPETPGPNEPVRITVEGVGTFLGNATVTWQKDGKVVATGIGVSSYSFITGSMGSVTRIKVTVASSVQGTLTREFVFVPSLVHLVWEADTTVPTFYLGKALYTAGSRLKVVAFPTIVLQGTRVSSSNISFQWRQNDGLVPAQSGLGKNTFTVYGDQLQTGEDISVELYINGAKVGRGEIFVPAVETQTIVYSKDPLRGLLLDQALFGNVSLLGKEVTLQAEPFFFAKTSRDKGLLNYEWTLNGAEATGPDSQRGLLTLRQTGTGSGFAAVGVTLQNADTDRLVQSAQTTLGITFGQQAGSLISNLFGL